MHAWGSEYRTCVHHRVQYRLPINRMDVPAMHRRQPERTRSAFFEIYQRKSHFHAWQRKATVVVHQYLEEAEYRERPRNPAPTSLEEQRTPIKKELGRILQNLVEKNLFTWWKIEWKQLFRLAGLVLLTVLVLVLMVKGEHYVFLKNLITTLLYYVLYFNVSSVCKLNLI